MKAIHFLAAVALILGACQAKKPTGTIEEREYEIAPSYATLDIRGAVSVVYDDTRLSVKVATDAACIDDIKVTRKGDKLIIDDKRGSIREETRVEVAVPASTSLEKVSLKGANNFLALYLRLKKLEIDAKGANNVEVDIKAGELKLVSSGADRMQVGGRADKLWVHFDGASVLSSADDHIVGRMVYCDVSGACTVNVKAEDSASGRASGASVVNLYGIYSHGIKTSGASVVNALGEDAEAREPQAR